MSSEKKKFRVIQIDGYADASSRLMELNNSALIVDKSGGIYLGNATDEANAYPIKVAIAEKDLENYVIVDELLEVEETVAAALIDLNDRKADKADVSALVLDLDKFLTKEEFIETEEVIADAITHLENNKVDISIASELYSLIGEKANASDLDYYVSVDRMTDAENAITGVLSSVEDLSTKLDTKVDASLLDEYVTRPEFEEVEEVVTIAIKNLEDTKAEQVDVDNLINEINKKADSEVINNDINNILTKINDISTKIVEKLDVSVYDVDINNINDKINTKADASLLEQYITKDHLLEVEEVTAAALNELNTNKVDVSTANQLYSLIGEKANVTDLDNYATVGRMTAAENTITSILSSVEDLSTKLDTKVDASLLEEYATKEHLLEVEYVAASALTDLDTRKVDISLLDEYATKASLDVVTNDVSLLRSSLNNYVTEAEVQQMINNAITLILNTEI